MLARINSKKAERESPENVCYTRMPVWSGDSDVDKNNYNNNNNNNNNNIS